MFCIKCGQQLADGDRFCTHCGAKVEAASEKVQMQPFAPVKIPEPKPAEEPVKISESKPAAELVHEASVPTQKPAPSPMKAEEKPEEKPAAKQSEVAVKKQKEKPEREKPVKDPGAILLLAMLGATLFPYILKSVALYVRKQTLSMPMAVGCEILAYVIAGIVVLFAAKQFSGKLKAAKVLQFLGAYAGGIGLISLIPVFVDFSSPVKMYIQIGILMLLMLISVPVMLSALSDLFGSEEIIYKKGGGLPFLLTLLALWSPTLVSFVSNYFSVETSFLSTGSIYLAAAFLTAVLMKLAMKLLRSKSAETARKESGFISFVVGVVLAVLAAGISVYELAPFSAVNLAAADVESYIAEAELQLARGDMEQAAQLYEKAGNAAQMWEQVSRGEYAEVSAEEPDDMLRYLSFLTWDSYRQRTYLAVNLEAQDIETMCPALLESYATQESLQPEEEEHQKELVALCIANECFVSLYPNQEKLTKLETAFEELSSSKEKWAQHLYLARAFGEMAKDDSGLDSTIDKLLTCAEEYPDDMSIQYYAATLGTSYLHDGAYHYERTADALERFSSLWLEKNEKRDKESIAAHYAQMASLLSLIQQFDKAVAYMEKAQELNPNSGSSMLQAAKYYMENGEMDKAYTAAKDMYKSSPEDCAVLWTYCISALKSEHIEESIQAAAELADLVMKSEGKEMDDAAVLLVNCVQYLAMDDSPEWTDYQYQVYCGEDTKKEYVKLFESNPLLENLVKTYYGRNTKHYREAMPYAEKAVELKPDCAQVHYAHGMLLYSMGEYEAARDEYLEADRLSPDDLSTLFALANTYDALEDMKTAFSYCQRVMIMLEGDVNHAVDWYGIGYHAPIMYNSLKYYLEQEENE